MNEQDKEDFKKIYNEYSNLVKEFKDFADNYKGQSYFEDFRSQFDEKYQRIRGFISNEIIDKGNETNLKRNVIPLAMSESIKDAYSQMARWIVILDGLYLACRGLKIS